MPVRPFSVEVDHEREVITIQGIAYTFTLFDELGSAAKGIRFEVGEREDGAVTLYRLDMNSPLRASTRTVGAA